MGGVANVGVGVANSGLNVAVGNNSDNDIDDVGGGNSEAFQDADIISDSPEPGQHDPDRWGHRGQPAHGQQHL